MAKASRAQKIYQAFKFFFQLTGQAQKFDSYFKVEKFTKMIHWLHFNQSEASEEQKKSFFKSQLLEIEIETHAYCNRRCSFCLNVSGTRLDKEQILSVDAFKRVIHELAEINFGGTIKFHRFNEPLANDIIFERIRYAREELPRAYLGFHSNGDYLTLDKLNKLEDTGMDFLCISLYIDFSQPCKSHISLAKKYCEEFIKRLNLKAVVIGKGSDLVRYKVLGHNLDFMIFVPDIYNEGDDRGGILKEYSRYIRTSP
jgi:hypothetical protein